MTIHELQAQCEASESRILAAEIRRHRSLELIKLEPAETALEELALYAYNVETIAEARAALFTAALGEIRHLQGIIEQHRREAIRAREAQRFAA